jgi:hypothetical protein
MKNLYIPGWIKKQKNMKKPKKMVQTGVPIADHTVMEIARDKNCQLSRNRKVPKIMEDLLS